MMCRSGKHRSLAHAYALEAVCWSFGATTSTWNVEQRMWPRRFCTTCAACQDSREKHDAVVAKLREVCQFGLTSRSFFSENNHLNPFNHASLDFLITYVLQTFSLLTSWVKFKRFHAWFTSFIWCTINTTTFSAVPGHRCNSLPPRPFSTVARPVAHVAQTVWHPLILRTYSVPYNCNQRQDVRHSFVIVARPLVKIVESFVAGTGVGVQCRKGQEWIVSNGGQWGTISIGLTSLA